jgi:hypothetical protein
MGAGHHPAAMKILKLRRAGQSDVRMTFCQVSELIHSKGPKEIAHEIKRVSI